MVDVKSLQHSCLELQTFLPANDTVMPQSIPTGYIPPGQPPETGSVNLLGGRDLTFKSCSGASNSTRAGIL